MRESTCSASKAFGFRCRIRAISNCRSRFWAPEASSLCHGRIGPALDMPWILQIVCNPLPHVVSVPAEFFDQHLSMKYFGRQRGCCIDSSRQSRALCGAMDCVCGCVFILFGEGGNGTTYPSHSNGTHGMLNAFLPTPDGSYRFFRVERRIECATRRPKRSPASWSKRKCCPA